MLMFEENNTLLCNMCGIIMVLQEPYDDEEESDEEFEVGASFVSCPHCHTVDTIQVAGGEEWCSGCGLDPSRSDYPVEELAQLWKEGSGIRETMERGVPKATMNRLYKFLTTLCGPHCSFAEDCPQSTKNFTTCFKEEVLDAENPDLLRVEEAEMGKRKRDRKARKKEKERIRKEKEKAVLQCASSGWYEKNLKPKNETENL